MTDTQIAFRCRIQYNSDIPKIKKFFEETDTINIALGDAGIALFATTPGDICYYIVKIHISDIYQLWVDRNLWPHGGIVRTIPAVSFITFIKTKEVNDDLQFEVDADATEMKLSVVDGMNEIRSISIPLTIPKVVHEYPSMYNANVVIKVNEFKKLCSDMAKASSEIRIESQPNAVKLLSGDAIPVCYGTWKDTEDTHVCYIKNTAFLKATKINIGNTKNSQAGIYVVDGYPVMIKVKLGSCDFIIYSKKWIDNP